MTSRYFYPSLATALVASLLHSPAFAQTAVKKLDQVVVTAARAPQLEQNVVGDITVINQQELAKAGQNSVVEILARQPGIEFYNSGGPQTASSVSIRGANPNQTLVLLNGMRINSSVNGGANWNAIDPASIERIEIIRGAASSLYGSDAIGGVINIITKGNNEDQATQFYGSVGVGSHKTIKSNVGLDGATDGFSYRFNASYAKSNGFNATNENNAFSYYDDKDGYHSNAFSGTLAYEWAADQSVGVNAYNSYINGDFDAGEFDWMGNDVRAAFTQTRQQSYDIYSKNRLTSNWLSTVSFGLSKEQSNTLVFDNRFSTLQRQYSWQNDFSITDNQDLTLLAERLEERITHNINYDNTRRNTNAFAAIYRADFGPHNLQASVRNDNISGYGNRTTGGLGYDFAINELWTVGAAANTGFKAPSFSQLYYPGSSNPDLSPEKSKNIEASLGYADAQSEFKVTVYQNKISNLIVSSFETGFIPFNVEKATIRGVTVYGAHDFGDLNLWASADFANPRNDDSRKQLTRRAKQNLKAGAQYQWQDLGLGAEYQYVSKRFDDADNSDEKRLGSYSLVNLTASYAIHKNLDAHLRWNNVFDKNYHSAYGYNMQGSNVFLNFAWRM